MKKFFYLVAIAIAFSSCQEEIDLELDDSETQVVVIEAMLQTNTLQPGTQQAVKVSKITSYYDRQKSNPVSTASVTLSESSGANSLLLEESQHPDSAGYYVFPSGYPFTIGTTYELSVLVEGESYTASSTLIEVPELDTTQVYLDDVQFIFASEFAPIAPEDTAYDIFAYFDNNKTKGDGYLLNYYVNGELKSEIPQDKSFATDEGFSDYVTAEVMDFAKRDAAYGDTITLEMLSVSPETVDFYFILFSQTDLSGNPFASSPPANVPTNFSNGARGFFQVSDVTYASTLFSRRLRD